MDEEVEFIDEGKDKSILHNIWINSKFQMFIDMCRIILVILMVVIIFILIKEKEAVKLLAYNPCALCSNKTGAICWLP